jgi:hypothetical protein
MTNIDFLKQQDDIVNYVKTNFKEYYGTLPDPSYTTDFLDFDKYKENVTVFFDFNQNYFDYLTNESESQEMRLSMFIAVRNDLTDKLREKMLKYASSLISMFLDDDANFGGIVDYGKVDTVNFYNAIEGVKGLKVAEIGFVLTKEAY